MRISKIFTYSVLILFMILSNLQMLDQANQVDLLSRQVFNLEKTIQSLESTICHEINMRSDRPKSKLNRTQCTEFIVVIHDQYLTESGEDGGLTALLTPSPESCPPLNQWCEIQRKMRRLYSK